MPCVCLCIANAARMMGKLQCSSTFFQFRPSIRAIIYASLGTYVLSIRAKGQFLSIYANVHDEVLPFPKPVNFFSTPSSSAAL